MGVGLRPTWPIVILLFGVLILFQNCGTNGVGFAEAPSTSLETPACEGKGEGEIWSERQGILEESSACASGAGAVIHRYEKITDYACQSGRAVALGSPRKGPMLESVGNCIVRATPAPTPVPTPISAPSGAKCPATRLTVATANEGLCSGPVPEASSGQTRVWTSAPSGMTGANCVAGNVQGSHSGVLTGPSYGTCHSYCSVMADCRNGEWVNLTYTW